MTSERELANGTSAVDESGSQVEAEHRSIDIEELADRVYRLMVAEVRLARTRGEWPGSDAEE